MAPKIKIIRKLGNTGMAAMATGAVLVTGITAAGAVSANMSADPTTTTTTVAVSTTTTEAPPATRSAGVPGLGTVEFTNGPDPQVVLVTPLPGVTFAVGTTDGHASVTFFDPNGVATVVTAEFEDGKLVVSLEDHIAMPTTPGSAPVVAPAPDPAADEEEADEEERNWAPEPAPTQSAAAPDPVPAPDTTAAPAPVHHDEDDGPEDHDEDHFEDHEDDD